MKKRSNAGLLLGLVIILIFFAGIGLVKIYTSLNTPISVSGNHEPQHSEPAETPDTSKQDQQAENNDQSNNNNATSEEDLDLAKARIEELQKLVEKTDSILISAMEEMRLDYKVISKNEEQLMIHEPLSLTWQRKTEMVDLSSSNVSIAEAKAALKTAASHAGSEVLKEAYEKGVTTLYIGFMVDGSEVVTHKISLRSKVKPTSSNVGIVGEGKGQLAFIIDDLGYDSPGFPKMMTISRPMTFSVLPHLPRSAAQARTVLEKGYNLFLHLPMEPSTPHDPGKGAIKVGMSDDDIVANIAEDLASLPAAPIGSNNHMGSKATADEHVMEVVLKYLKERGLIFVDSKTAPNSVVAKVAQEVGESYGVNRLFIDNKDELDAIKIQIRQAAKMALRDGKAICIGHVRKNTADAILQMIDEVESMGVKIVFAKDLLEQ